MTKIELQNEQSILSTLEFNNVGIEQIKTELEKNVEFSKGLTINDLEDKTQFKIVKDAKNGYVKTRNTIKRAFKSKRDEYNSLSKENLEAERNVISVIEDEEKRLNDLVKNAELELLKKQNEPKLQERKENLLNYDYKSTDEELIILSDKEYDSFLLEKKELYLEKKEAEYKKQQEEEQRKKEIEEAKKQAKLEAEQEAERKHKEEIDKIKKDQEEKELREKQAKLDEEARLKKEEAEKQTQKELMEKRKAFTEYRDSIDFDHYEDKDGKRIFYKKVGEFKIN